LVTRPLRRTQISLKFPPLLADGLVERAFMDGIDKAERLDPSSRIGDAQPEHRQGTQPEGRRKKVKPPSPPPSETAPDADDESHQLDELA
jgi:hypothetical protein